MENNDKLVYKAPQLKVYGKFKKVVQSGGGKVSITIGDPGEPLKTKGSE